MAIYNPDKWVIIEITNQETKKVHHRVFASWSGGYLSGDSWKMNSGITAVTADENYYHFDGYSGSTYATSKCMV